MSATLAALLAPGCVSVAGLPSRADHGDGEFVLADDADALWARVEATLEQEGYAVDPELTVRAQGRFVSTWFEQTDPIRRRERRRRVSVWIEPGEDGRFLVSVAVQRQRSRTADALPRNSPAAADRAWIPDGVDEDAADLLLYKIELGMRQR